MKKKEIYEIINNQEDEDGYSLNPGNTIINENAKSVLRIFSRHNTVYKKSGIDQLRSCRLFVSARIAEKKL